MTPKRNRRGANRRSSQNKNPVVVSKQKLSSSPLWALDSSLLMESFPDTQIWNSLAEHEPRCGAVNARDNKIYNLVQTVCLRGWITSSVTLPNAKSISFKLNDLAQSSQLTSVFDQYMIRQVECWLIPTTLQAAPLTDSNIITVIDYDDDNTLVSEAAALSYQNATITQPNEGVYRRFRPHLAVATYNGAFTAYKNEISSWLDSASTTVQHYGFKVWITQFNSGSQVTTYDLKLRYWVQMRNVF